MQFGIITPVFEGCLDSLELLYQDLCGQFHQKWTWMLCSNGYSAKLDSFASGKKSKLLEDHLNDKADIIYTYTPFEETPDFNSLLINVGKRRDFCIKSIEADYLFLFDADAKILDPNMFRYLEQFLTHKQGDICIYKIQHELKVLPTFPVEYCDIDLLNFVVKDSLAKKVGYPTDLNLEEGMNDYRYFTRVFQAAEEQFLFIDKIFAYHNGNNQGNYVSMMEMYYNSLPQTFYNLIYKLYYWYHFGKEKKWSKIITDSIRYLKFHLN